MGIRREPAGASGGLGRLVQPNAQLLQPQVHECARAVVSEDDRTLSVSFVRSAAQGLHSVNAEYRPDAVLLSLRLGTRPEFARRAGCVVLRMAIEHTTFRLREPLRGRRLEMAQPGAALTSSS
jgi:hypothetical protein